MPVHAQRGADLRVLLKPSRRQGGLPVPHSLHILPQRLDLAPQRLHLRAAVQAQDRAPFPGHLVPERLRIAHPGQDEERQEEQNGGQPVIPLGQRQERPRVVQKPLLQQHRQPGQHPPAGNRRQRFRKLRPDLAQMPRRSQHSSRRVPSPTAHRRCPVAGVPCASVNRRLRRVPLRCFLRRLPLRRCVRNRISLCRPGRLPPTDNPRPAIVVQRLRRDPHLPRNRRAAQPRGQKPVHRPRHRGINHARPAAPARRKEARLAVPPELVHRPLYRRAAHAERLHQVQATDTALRKLRDPKQLRFALIVSVKIKRFKIGEILHSAVPLHEGKAGVANLDRLGGAHRKRVHRDLGAGYWVQNSLSYSGRPVNPPNAS